MTDAWIIFDAGYFMGGGVPGPGSFDVPVDAQEFERWIMRAMQRGWARIELTVTALLDDPRRTALEAPQLGLSSCKPGKGQ